MDWRTILCKNIINSITGASVINSLLIISQEGSTLAFPLSFKGRAFSQMAASELGMIDYQQDKCKGQPSIVELKDIHCLFFFVLLNHKKYNAWPELPRMQVLIWIYSFKESAIKYIMPITKINKESDFTPWEEETVNIVRLIRSPTLKRTPRDPSKTITNFALDRSPSHTPKKSIERAYFSLTKINFYHPPPIITRVSTPQKHFSFKYDGPRLNFYLSMNPKQLRLTEEHKRITKTIDRESLVSTNASNQPTDSKTYRTIQNESKGLKKDPSYSHMQLVGNASNIRRMKEQHKNMKKLKILYHSRALKKKT